jgi:hypothetical protein
VRVHVVAPSLAFGCPGCGARLIIDYWDGKTNLFRVLFWLGAVALVWALWTLRPGAFASGAFLTGYVALGWVVLLRLRRVIFADGGLGKDGEHA